MATINGIDPRQFATDMLTDVLLDAKSDPETAIDRYFTPDYVQTSDGEVLDRAAFAEHVTHVRAAVSKGELVIHEQVCDGSTLAQRHTVRLTKTDDTVVEMEVYLFASLRDGRVARIDEISRLVSGSTADRGLASAR